MGHLAIENHDAPLYTVGEVAQMLEVPHAYLRRLENFDLVSPRRSPGGQRRYSRREIVRVERVNSLVDEGLTLAAARRVLMLEDRLAELEVSLGPLRAPAWHNGGDR
ncbi:MAG: helix-turn-helix domain-containing protein [Acidimicrobiales bacterium]